MFNDYLSTVITYLRIFDKVDTNNNYKGKFFKSWSLMTSENEINVKITRIRVFCFR